MSADPKLYEDSDLSTEVEKDGDGNYTLQLGPDTGLDGDEGETVTKQLWLANEGDETYQNAELEETDDSPEYGYYSLDDETYEETGITFGDIEAGSDVSFYVKVEVPADADRGRYDLNFDIKGQSI